jgi:hypothetical protein
VTFSKPGAGNTITKRATPGFPRRRHVARIRSSTSLAFRISCFKAYSNGGRPWPADLKDLGDWHARFAD